MDSLLIALQFLTRNPIRCEILLNDADTGQSALYYPIVGFLIGILLCVSVLLLSATPDMLAAALVLALWVWLTRSFHLQGFINCASFWADNFKQVSTAVIAKLALYVLLFLKWLCIWVLIQNNQLSSLMLVPLLGRTSTLLLMLSTPYVSPRGWAEKILQNLCFEDARWVIVISLTFAGMFLGWANVLLAVLLMLWIRSAAIESQGGVTDDVFGAAVELTEVAALFVVALI
jgi:adenosylcobinamide-GDP ribazoletransferase